MTTEPEGPQGSDPRRNGWDDPDGPGHPMDPNTLEAEDRAEGGGMGGSRRDRRRAKRSARKRARKAKPWWRRAIPTWRMALAGLMALIVAGVVAFITMYALVQVPDPNAAAIAQSNVYYYADGKTELGRTGQTNRISVPIDQIAVTMQRAAVSAEDRTFYSNQGVSISGTVRAAWDTLTGKGLQGGSTITQQYVKNYYLTQDQTLTRKAKEFFISLKVDQTESKDEIMAGYLNTSYFGRGAYGVQAAAQSYYGVSAADLDVPQSAYLAALLQAPSAYDVGTATPAGKAAAVARWNYVLDGMVKLGWVAQSDRAAMAFPKTLPPGTGNGNVGQAGYLIDIAAHYLDDNGIVDPAALNAGGWKITTTFVKKDQDALAAAVQSELKDKLPKTTTAKDVRAAAGSVDPATGRLLAAYGGPDYSVQQFNDALRTDYQVGSTFKAFDLAAGLQNHATTQDGVPITPSTIYDGTSERQVQGLPAGMSFNPQNEDQVDYGPISLRYAMEKSVNSVYAQEGADAGLDNVRKAAIAAGLPADTPGMEAVPAITLGSATPNVIQMAGAYATLASHGQQITPWVVQTLFHNGNAQTLPDHKAVAAFSRSTADTVTSVLESVISPGGTGYLALDLNRPAAGKTGTSDGNRSAWFVGYTPQLVTAVGLFGENSTTHHQESLATAAGIARVNGGSYPTQIWTTYMDQALGGQPVLSFDLQVPQDTSGQSTATASPSATASGSASATATPSGSPSGTGTPTASPTQTPSTGGPTAPTTTPAPPTVPATPPRSGSPRPGAVPSASGQVVP
ncbi:transglycosylase domain-containing protein [Streptacidiphilus cavernicola]|uniref:Transglycosylase domain-containing protein n=1 Tax=Streptacidiphilus cavernicola TaxID=3342716 RepID=A0ABV6W036_9ACTN